MKRGNLNKHLIHASVLRYDHDDDGNKDKDDDATTTDTTVVIKRTSTGIRIIDVNLEIEHLIAASGMPHTILRCGSYMEDTTSLIHGSIYLKRESFAFPLTRAVDFPTRPNENLLNLWFVVRKLLFSKKSGAGAGAGAGPVDDGPIDFIEPNTYFIVQVEQGGGISNPDGAQISHFLSIPYLASGVPLDQASIVFTTFP